MQIWGSEDNQWESVFSQRLNAGHQALLQHLPWLSHPASLEAKNFVCEALCFANNEFRLFIDIHLKTLFFVFISFDFYKTQGVSTVGAIRVLEKTQKSELRKGIYPYHAQNSVYNCSADEIQHSH